MSLRITLSNGNRIIIKGYYWLDAIEKDLINANAFIRIDDHIINKRDIVHIEKLNEEEK